MAEGRHDVRDASVGSKLLFGGLAGDRKQDFVTLTTETESIAEGIVFKVKQNEAAGIAAKINFYIRKAQQDAPTLGQQVPDLAAVARNEAVPAREASSAGSGRVDVPTPTTVVASPVRSNRSNADLLHHTSFRLAIGDAQRLGLVTSFEEIATKTLAVGLSDIAMTSPSTESLLGRIFQAYDRITSEDASSILLLQRGGQSVGEYTATGLARGDWR